MAGGLGGFGARGIGPGVPGPYRARAGIGGAVWDAFAANRERGGGAGKEGGRAFGEDGIQGMRKTILALPADYGEWLEGPDMKGFSGRNLKYMRFFAQHCPDLRFGQQSAAQLSWFHIVVLMTQVSDPAEREWYASQAISNGWPRTTLEVQIKAPDDKPTIGMLLCKTQNRLVAEYALSGIDKPNGVAVDIQGHSLPVLIATL